MFGLVFFFFTIIFVVVVCIFAFLIEVAFLDMCIFRHRFFFNLCFINCCFCHRN